MREVTFVQPASGRGGLKTEVGSATFAAVPLERRGDFRCTPSDLISFTDAKRIADGLQFRQVVGEVETKEGPAQWMAE